MLTHKTITVAVLAAAGIITPLAALRPAAQAVPIHPIRKGTMEERPRRQTADPAAAALFVKMYAAYRALRSFSCTVVSTVHGRNGSDAVNAPVGRTTFAVEKPYRVAITRRSVQDGTTRAVCDGATLYVTKTGDNTVDPLRYLKLPLRKDSANIALDLSEFGRLPSRGDDEFQMFVPYAIFGYDAYDPSSRFGFAWKMGRPGEVDGVPVDTLTLRLDNGKADSKQYISVTLRLGRRDHLLRQVVSRAYDGVHAFDQSVATFQDIKANPMLPALLFAFTPPPGTQPVPEISEWVARR